MRTKDVTMNFTRRCERLGGHIHTQLARDRERQTDRRMSRRTAGQTAGTGRAIRHSQKWIAVIDRCWLYIVLRAALIITTYYRGLQVAKIVHGTVATALFVDEHVSFNRIRQVAPICIHISCVVPWADTSLPPNEILICSSCLAEFKVLTNIAYT